jgi:hypothetical protein
MGIASTLNDIASGIDSVKRTHDDVLFFHEKYVKPALKNKPARVPLTVNAPGNIHVMQPVTISGTGTGLIRLYSEAKLERGNIYPDKGKWAVREYFSVPGEYILTAKDSYSVATITVHVSP